MAVFGSGAITKDMSHKMLRGLQFCVKPTNRSFIAAKFSPEKREGPLNELPTSLRVKSTNGFLGTVREPILHPYRLMSYDSATSTFGLLSFGTQDSLRCRLRISTKERQENCINHPKFSQDPHSTEICG